MYVFMYSLDQHNKLFGDKEGCQFISCNNMYQNIAITNFLIQNIFTLLLATYIQGLYKSILFYIHCTVHTVIIAGTSCENVFTLYLYFDLQVQKSTKI